MQKATSNPAPLSQNQTKKKEKKKKNNERKEENKKGEDGSFSICLPI